MDERAIPKAADYSFAIFDIGDLPTLEEMAEAEKRFYSKCQLDTRGRRTNIQRVPDFTENPFVQWRRACRLNARRKSKKKEAN